MSGKPWFAPGKSPDRQRWSRPRPVPPDADAPALSSDYRRPGLNGDGP